MSDKFIEPETDERVGQGRISLLGADPLRILIYLSAAALFLGTPFALKAGAEFFLPLVAALVIAIALVPALEWLERRGLPSSAAALVCVLTFLLLINGALALIILPASGWFIQLPQSLPRIRDNLAPLIDFYASLQRFVDQALQSFATNTAAQAQAVAVETPDSLMDYLTSSAPAAAIQTFFAILLIFFFLSGWTKLRRQTIRSRGSFDSAMHTARIIQNVVDATSAYLTTIVFINAGLGLAVALLLWALGMPSPFMWGGIVSLCNFVPYVGPIIAAGLLAMGGLMTFDSVALALMPAFIQIGLHTVEANIVTPMVLGRRLTINPLLILLSLSYWGWVWGAPGAFLAVPLLIILQTILSSASNPSAARPGLESAGEDDRATATGQEKFAGTSEGG
jgi:predicted PurR-regulated permease PerM